MIYDSFNATTVFDSLFAESVSMVKFVKEEGNLDNMSAKELVEWFLANCPHYIKGWNKIRLLSRLAKMAGEKALIIVAKSEAYRVRSIGEKELYDRFNIRVVSESACSLQERIPYEFPETSIF